MSFLANNFVRFVGVGAVNTERSHEVRQRFPQDQLAVLGSYRFGAEPGQDQTRQVAEGELVAARHRHVEGEWPVDAFVLKPVAGVAPGQRAERHRSRHKAALRVRFAGPDQLVYLIGEGEAPPRRWWGFADRLDGAAQIGQGFPDRNQAVLFITLHGFPPFPHAPQTGSRAADGRVLHWAPKPLNCCELGYLFIPCHFEHCWNALLIDLANEYAVKASAPFYTDTEKRCENVRLNIYKVHFVTLAKVLPRLRNGLVVWIGRDKKQAIVDIGHGDLGLKGRLDTVFIHHTLGDLRRKDYSALEPNF